MKTVFVISSDDENIAAAATRLEAESYISSVKNLSIKYDRMRLELAQKNLKWSQDYPLDESMKTHSIPNPKPTVTKSQNSELFELAQKTHNDIRKFNKALHKQQDSYRSKKEAAWKEEVSKYLEENDLNLQEYNDMQKTYISPDTRLFIQELKVI